MKIKNSVFIATSLDGYISDKNGGIEWLHSILNPANEDLGYAEFSKGVDTLIMGRKTFETVCGFDIDWPYQKPVFVLSNSLNELPKQYRGKAFLVNGPLREVLEHIHQLGYYQLYIDGGATIQSFLQEDLIDEMIITIIPVLLGGGTPLFSNLPDKLEFECIDSKIYLGQVVQNHFRRKR